MTNKNRARIAALAGLTAAAIALTACSGGAAAGTDTFGVSLNSLEYPMVVIMNDAMQETAADDDVALTTVDARNNTATEMSQIEDLITRKPSVIIMNPIDSESSQSAGARVNAADIPLVTMDNNFAEDADVDVVSYVGSDATESGRLQAKYLNEMLPDGGNIIYLVGIYGAPWTERRKEGFLEVLNDNITIVSEMEAKGSRAQAKSVTEDLLRRYSTPGEIDALVAINDEMGLGAISAIEESGRMDEFKVIIAADGSDPALDAVEAGKMTATIAQDPIAVGKTAIETARKVAAGESVERVIHIPQQIITADNVAKFRAEHR